MEYLFLCAYDDTGVKEAISKVMPKLVIGNLPDQRICESGNFLYWKKKLNISYEDFIMNDKYIVLSSCLFWSEGPFDKLSESGLLRADLIETIIVD